jgi:ribosome-associated toxin RatA of RatAB toxin-antitoxin module
MVFLISPTSAVLGKNLNPTKPQWEIYKSENGITGYERKVKDSKYIETRSETVISSPIENLLEVIKDVSSYPKWMYDCKQAIELQNNNDHSRLIYFVQRSPLGSPDRDVIVQANSIVNWKMGTYIISLHSINHDLSQYLDIETDQHRQRMTEYKGRWEFQMIDRGKTKVIYTVFTDPGGYSPAFLVNSIIRKVSFVSLSGLKSIVNNKRYTEAANLSETKKSLEANWHYRAP